MAKDRKAGYYWIQKDDKWLIAEWIYGYWYIAGSELEYSDTEIYEVGDYIGRVGNKVYSENANCAIFDVSHLLAFIEFYDSLTEKEKSYPKEDIAEIYLKANCG